MIDEETGLDELMEWLYDEAYKRELRAEIESNVDDDSVDNAEKQPDDADYSEAVSANLAGEREQILESEMYIDDHPEEREPNTDAETERAAVKHEMLKTAITRIENAARTPQDFYDVTEKWDTLAKNEARRLRNHEISRGDVPLDYGKAMDGAIIPLSFMEPRWKQLLSGNFIDLIHDCPFEMDELVTDTAISRMIRSLSGGQKEIFYWLFIRQYSCDEVGRLRGQTGRNIRKTRGVILRKLQRKLCETLTRREQAGVGLSLRQKRFLSAMASDTLDDDIDE